MFQERKFLQQQLYCLFLYWQTFQKQAEIQATEQPVHCPWLLQNRKHWHLNKDQRKHQQMLRKFPAVPGPVWHLIYFLLIPD